MRILNRWIVALALALVGCPAPSDSDSVVSDDLETSGAEEEAGPPALLARFGSFFPREYLFAGAAFGREGLVAADLVRVEADLLVVRLDGGGEREFARADAWPMACLTQPLEIREGALTITLASGAPVLVLASSQTAARVAIGLSTEHSVVVRVRRLAFDSCPGVTPASASSRVADVASADAACVYADQETLDGAAGQIVPPGAPAEILETDGEWARVRVSVEGGTVNGWMAASLIESGSGAGRGFDAALGNGRCVFVGRVVGPPTRPPIQEEDRPQGTLTPEQIARVIREGQLQLVGCYDTRRTDLADARVTLELILLVDEDGRVYEVRTPRGAEIDAQLTACALARARRWRFPPPGAGVLQVRHAFELGGPRP
jgi:hypothetical protein